MFPRTQVRPYARHLKHLRNMAAEDAAALWDIAIEIEVVDPDTLPELARKVSFIAEHINVYRDEFRFRLNELYK